MNTQTIPFLFRMFGPATLSAQQNDPPNTETFGKLVKEESRNVPDRIVSTILFETFNFASDNLKEGESITKVKLVIPDTCEECSESVWSVVCTTEKRFFKIHAHIKTAFSA